MNSFRSRPMPLGRALAAAPARWAAATTSTFQPWHFAQSFSSSPSSFFTASKTSFSASPSTSKTSIVSKSHVPSPIPLVPDVATFLSVIGRNMKQHAAKFPSWEALFTLTSQQLRELGIDPPRDRRYLLRWVQRFREGRFGIAGDFQFVRNGVAELRVHETVDPQDPLIVRKFVLNVPVPPEAEAAAEGEAGAEAETEGAVPAEDAAETATGYDLNAPPVRVRGYKVVGAKAIAGPYALPLKQQAGSRLTVTEGMWEDKRGHKIDGGERRQAEVRFRRRAAERRAARESFGQ
ncbi:telomere length regulation protein [Sporothrix bragantina]|uniref:Small ribosomal subunit protein mS41 n=1 Tax=Sporothrix bragantina TaxID=671064 RepID=A0ABP0CMF5_9PEZI